MSKSTVIFINRGSSSTLWLSDTHSALDTKGENRSWIRRRLGRRSTTDCKPEHLEIGVFGEVTICLWANISRRFKGSSSLNLHLRSWTAWSSKWRHSRRSKRQDRVLHPPSTGPYTEPHTMKSTTIYLTLLQSIRRNRLINAYLVRDDDDDDHKMINFNIIPSASPRYWKWSLY
jgi:hypothetical protein